MLLNQAIKLLHKLRNTKPNTHTQTPTHAQNMASMKRSMSAAGLESDEGNQSKKKTANPPGLTEVAMVKQILNSLVEKEFENMSYGGGEHARERYNAARARKALKLVDLSETVHRLKKELSRATFELSNVSDELVQNQGYLSEACDNKDGVFYINPEPVDDDSDDDADTLHNVNGGTYWGRKVHVRTNIRGPMEPGNIIRRVFVPTDEENETRNEILEKTFDRVLGMAKMYCSDDFEVLRSVIKRKRSQHVHADGTDFNANAIRRS